MENHTNDQIPDLGRLCVIDQSTEFSKEGQARIEWLFNIAIQAIPELHE